MGSVCIFDPTSHVSRWEEGPYISKQGAINQEFVRTDESLREFHKTLDGKKADQSAADKTRAELTQLVDRLEGVLSAMADVMTINDLIKRLIAIETDEVQEIQRLKILLQKKEDELLNNALEPNK